MADPLADRLGQLRVVQIGNRLPRGPFRLVLITNLGVRRHSPLMQLDRDDFLYDAYAVDCVSISVSTRNPCCYRWKTRDEVWSSPLDKPRCIAWSPV